MKFIDIGICVNNKDPKGIGRIRYRPYGVFTSEIENGVKYDEWDEKDPFLAIPFLPLHINIIPQIQQSVKLLKYDTEKDTQNVEYVAGPYTSPHDLQNQTFLVQHQDTTYGGTIVKGTKEIRNKSGKFNSPVTKGSMVDDKDTGVRGNYGSDVFFTENGIQLRGGSLISKNSGKKDVLDYPQVAKKMARFNLKKFPKTHKTTRQTVDTSKIAVSKLRYIIEYEIDDFDIPTLASFYIYKVIGGDTDQFNTDVFDESSILPIDDTKALSLININDNFTGVTFQKTLKENTIQSAYIEIRNILQLLDGKGLSVFGNKYLNDEIHPFYFRPTNNLRLVKHINKTTFINKIQVRNISGGSGLIYSRQNATPPLISNKKIDNVAKEVKNAGEQSFSSLSADKIFLTSTSPNVGPNVKAINFNELDEYELTQEDYVNKIEPNTYALVRGENLYNVLMAMVKLMESHIHNINEPLVQSDPRWIELSKLISTLRDDLLNESLRIN